MIPKDEDAKQFAILACKPFKHFPKDGSQFPYVGDLAEGDTVNDILWKFYSYAEQNGIETGKRKKETEIIRVLGLNKD